jgi:signal peptidase I/ribosomal protein L40E
MKKEETRAYVPVYCPRCGAPNLPGAKLCGQCGTALKARVRTSGILRKVEANVLSAGRWIAKNEVLYEFLSFLLVLGALYLGIMGGLMVLLMTDSPLRSVYSDSMNHRTVGDGWRAVFEERGVSTSNFPLQGGFAKGDLLLIRGVDPAEIRVGDVVVYEGSRGLIVHRVLEIRSDEKGNLTFQTKGDANIPFDAPIRAEAVVGKVIAVVPKLGWLSIWWRGG